MKILKDIKNFFKKKENSSINLIKYKKMFTYISLFFNNNNIGLTECKNNLGGFLKNEIILPKEINTFNNKKKNYNLYIYKILIFNYLNKLNIKNTNIIQNIISYSYSIKKTRNNIESDGIKLINLEKLLFPSFFLEIKNKILLVLLNKLMYKKIKVYLLKNEKEILYKLENIILVNKNIINKQIKNYEFFFKNDYLNFLHLWGYQYQNKIKNNFNYKKNIKYTKRNIKYKNLNKLEKVEYKKQLKKNLSLDNLFNYDKLNDKSYYKKQINFDKSSSSKNSNNKQNILQNYYEKIKYFNNEINFSENKLQVNNFKKYSYKEWDYKLLNYKPNWCNVYEYNESSLNNNKLNHDFINFKKKYTTNINYIREKLYLINNKNTWKKKQIHGEEIDFDEFINNYSENKNISNEKIFKIKRKKDKNISISILIDASLSTDNNIYYENKIEIIKKWALFISLSIDKIFNYTISFFFSNTRHDCKYINIKNFKDNFHKKRLNIINIKSSGYTRIGPAIRHNIELIKKRKDKFKMIILLSDGMPTDYDQYEGLYGENDVKASINEAATSGILTKFIIINKEKNLNFLRKIGFKNYLIMNDLKKYKDLLKIFNEINYK